MARRTSFKKDAESVQGNPGAWVEFRAIKRGMIKRWLDRDDDEITDDHILINYALDWDGLEDDEGKPIPSPKDDPSAYDELYGHERTAICRLLIAGPDPEDPN
jgi:hypothetical protein